MVLQGNHFLKYLKIPQKHDFVYGEFARVKTGRLRCILEAAFQKFFWPINKGEKSIATPLVAQGYGARVVQFSS